MVFASLLFGCFLLGVAGWKIAKDLLNSNPKDWG
jgi:hypothetical protein